MLIIPAIDIKNGKCVRLTQGRMDAETVYSENPVEIAKKWEEACRTFPEGIAVGIDAVDGMVATRGWVKVTKEKAVDLAKSLEGLGVSCIIYTDIARDGMLTGPNVKATKEMAHAVSIPVVASGGMSSVKDIESFKGLKLEGVIIGKALYTGDIDLREAIELAEKL